jgi:hypothetical protein
MLGVSCRVNFNEYNAITTPEYRSFFGSAYTLALQLCVVVVDRFLHAAPGDDHGFSVCLEDGHRNAGEALQYLREALKNDAPLTKDQITEMFGDSPVKVHESSKPPRVRLTAAERGTKKANVPLQAADILAHCTLRSSDPAYGSALDTLKLTSLHREVVATQEVIYAVALTAVEEERRRMAYREQLHMLSRFVGWGGVKLKTGANWIAFDSRNLIPVDRDRMLAADPSIIVTPPPTDPDPS